MQSELNFPGDVKVCGLEKTKAWKTGFSVKCPNSTAVVYINLKGRGLMYLYWLQAKRKGSCSKCKLVSL